MLEFVVLLIFYRDKVIKISLCGLRVRMDDEISYAATKQLSGHVLKLMRESEMMVERTKFMVAALLLYKSKSSSFHKTKKKAK